MLNFVTNCTDMFKKFTIVTALLLTTIFSSSAFSLEQNSVILARAKSLLEHSRWGDARNEYLRLKQNIATDDFDMIQQVEYGLTVCAANLDDNIAEQIMISFLSRYPGSVHTADVRFLLALYYCETEQFKSAKAQFSQIGYNTLTKENKEKYNIRMGYIEFIEGNLNSAFNYFDRISQASDYIDHATYYKSYIHYVQGDTEAAYNGFASLKNSASYSKLIPLYLIQLEFDRGNYKYVITECDALIQNTSGQERTTVMRVAAEAWYRLEGYSKSLQYITAYKQNGGNMGRNEQYLLGYTSYRTADYAGAVEPLKSLCNSTDALAQNASYHLADCYIRLGDKRNAIRAFAMATDEQYDPQIAEDALFNYGKLIFETGGGTFNESINVLTRYITRYPYSERANEVRELLIAAYYNSQDYDMAYQAIRSFPNPDGNMKTALQKIAYFRGLEAFKNENYQLAKESVEEALHIGVSPKYNALCSFWLGEIAYQSGDIKQAIKHYNNYVKRAPRNADEYKMALYNLGYAYITEDNLAAAQRSFDGFIWLYKQRDSYRADGFNRLADVHYLQRDYQSAIKNYEGAIAINTEESHYARFRRAISLGLQGKIEPKISALKNIIKAKRGDYVDDASYELGRTYISTGSYSSGASALEQLLADNPSSPYATAAMLDLGLVYFNLGNTNRSLNYYDKVITAAPQSQAAKDAMQSVREIYVSRGDVKSYFAYAERTGVECDLSMVTRDSLSYRAAEKIYLAGKVEESVKHFERYIADYPRGYYIDDALFCLSDSYLKCDSLDRAMERMKLLADRPINRYTIPVLNKLGDVAFQHKMYTEAAAAFRRLYDAENTADARMEASRRYVEATIADNEDNLTLAMADHIATLTDVEESVRRKAQFSKAKVLDKQGDKSAAIDIFKTLSADKSDLVGSESCYIVICDYFNKGDHNTAEKLVYEMADTKSTNSYFLGRAFIILGDIYAAKGDAFQARATYQSIIDGYTPADDGVVAEAKERVTKLL